VVDNSCQIIEYPRIGGQYLVFGIRTLAGTYQIGRTTDGAAGF
jgi:hypothetical protein